MKDEDKIKEQLIEEMESLRKEVSELKQEEAACKKAEERFRTIFENANDEIIYVDKYGKIIAVNQRCEDIFGYNQSEVIGKNFAKLDIFEPEDAPKIIKLFRGALKGGEVVSLIELEVKHKNGNKIPVEVSTRPIKKNGELEGFLNIVRDITARKQAEEELQQVSSEQKELLSKVRAMIFWIDKRGKFVRVNEAFASALDKTPDEIKGRSLYDLYPREQAQAFVRDNLEVIEHGIPKRSIEEPVETPEGTMWVSTSKIPYKDVDGNIAGIIGFSIDITERKRAEEEIKAKSQFLESLIEQSPLPTFVIDPEGICLMVNKAFLKAYNVPKKEMVLGRNALTEPTNVRQGVVKYIKEALSGKVVETPEIEFISPYENKRTVTKSKLFPIFDATNKLTNVVVMHEDITEQVQVGRALRKSEEKYRNLFQNARDVIVTFDLKGNVTSINKAIAEYGFKEDEFVGKNMLKFVSKKYWPRLLKELAKIIQGKPIEGEIEITTPKGEKIAEYKSNPIREGGKIIGLQTILRDITAHKKAEEELRSSEERLKILFEFAPDAYYLNDLKGNFIDGNKAAAELIGYKREELIRRSFLKSKLLPPGQIPKAAELLAKNVLGQPTGPDEFTLNRKDGSQVSVEIRTFPVKIKEQTLVLGIARDITERKKAEEQLKQYALIVESANDALFIKDLQSRYILVNNKVLELFGDIPREKIIGKTDKELMPLEDALHNIRDDQEVFKTGQQRDFIKKNTIEGKDYWLHATKIPLRDDKDKIIGLVGIARDITERKRMDAERRELEQKAHLTSHLATIGEMASGIAHEINNPLTAVIGFAQLLMQKDLPEDIKEYAKIINDGGQRVANIVKRLLTFARQQKPERDYVDINQIIENTLQLRAYGMETSNIKVTSQLDTDLPGTMADARQLQQVFLNITINAETEMRLAHGKGKLSIKTEAIDNTIRISFKDDGPGIAKKKLDKIFDPFFTTRKIGEGTGLGLSICHGIMVAHGGRIYAKSKLGQGATFIVELPIITEDKQLELAEPGADESKRVTKARILVVDDEPAILQFLSQILTAEGHKVQTTDNARDALERINSERYSLILLDIKLPGMSGTELYKSMQKIAQSLARRVVFITGDVMGVDTRDFLSKTKAPYITKPFDIEQLKKDINRVLTQRA